MIIFWFLFVFCFASTDFWSRFWDTLYQENDRDSRDSFHDLPQVSENCILNCIYQHINHLCYCYLLYEHVADRQKTFYSQVPGLFHHNSAEILPNAIVMQNLFLMGVIYCVYFSLLSLFQPVLCLIYLNINWIQ